MVWLFSSRRIFREEIKSDTRQKLGIIFVFPQELKFSDAHWGVRKYLDEEKFTEW